MGSNVWEYVGLLPVLDHVPKQSATEITFHSVSYQSRMRTILVGYYQMARGADYIIVHPHDPQLCRDKTQEPSNTGGPFMELTYIRKI